MEEQSELDLHGKQVRLLTNFSNRYFTVTFREHDNISLQNDGSKVRSLTLAPITPFEPNLLELGCPLVPSNLNFFRGLVASVRAQNVIQILHFHNALWPFRQKLQRFELFFRPFSVLGRNIYTIPISGLIPKPSDRQNDPYYFFNIVYKLFLTN